MAFLFNQLKPAPRAEAVLFSRAVRVFGGERQFADEHLLLFCKVGPFFYLYSTAAWASIIG